VCLQRRWRIVILVFDYILWQFILWQFELPHFGLPQIFADLEFATCATTAQSVT